MPAERRPVSYGAEQKHVASIEKPDGPCAVRARPRFRRYQMKKMFAILAVASLMTAAACNTVRGAGADLESASNAVDNKM